ncbi:Phosphoribosylaminoimidazole carboxylase catalytic subunit [hydrothermal vent metagenome]|jgi:5-(carboxyamino)imidazole ribonucleotide mutase|uniref:Phosphoribosylaminoimidazole carboxylase catalytic subunit n=1 Tax=hydrothermal vent metagenome TaxID=652676 RepID=A0A161K1G5_9ZZZZ|nr:5-(carboxyamino)imidazole ribonucleotide mutase [Gammaproteobacteria bacterium]PDH43174.1 MAG: 5-(carboxyamino)imidazole ribonucleotide mutase [Candidatus Thioglobus sp. MED-G25]|tara:strand:+ start:6232 stop:6762 length:531 start_codon:yes stop_codon:yes gene_type:complete
MSKKFVSVLMGSDSDLSTVQSTLDTLSALAIPFEVKITSAHRTPDDTRRYVRDAEERGCTVFVAAAGLAAHLAGTVAAHTLKPVIGIPMDAGPLNGHDALLSTVQMPGGIPVACVAIGKAGAKNAAYLSAQILAISDAELAERLRAEREANAQLVRDKDHKLQTNLDKQNVLSAPD